MAKNNKMTRRRGPNKPVTLRDVKNLLESTAELKRFVTSNTGIASTTVGTVVNLTNSIVQGDDLNQRSGDQIKIVKNTLHFRATAVTTSQSFRVIIFKDLTNRGSTPAVTEILNSANYMVMYTPTPMQQSRFKIYADFMLDCNINGETIKHKYVTWKGTKCFYNGSTAVATANGPGALFFLLIGEAGSGLWDWSYQATYHDL
jgi:hypothetical protein